MLIPEKKKAATQISKDIFDNFNEDFLSLFIMTGSRFSHVFNFHAIGWEPHLIPGNGVL